MAQSLKELLDTRASLWHEAKGILVAAEKEDRDLNPGERESYDRLDAEIDRLTVEIDGKEADARRREKHAALEASFGNPAPRQTATGSLAGGTKGDAAKASPRRDAFLKYIAAQQLSAGEVEALTTLQVDKDTKGGYVVMEEQFINELLADITDETVMRRLCRVLPPVNANVSIGAPRLTSRASTFAWGSELSAPTEDAAMAFGKRKLVPHHMTGEVVVSRDLLRAAVLSVDEIVRSELARDAGELQEAAFLTGSGSQQPLGIFTASNDGIPTSRDVSTGNTSTAIQIDGLIEALGSLKDSYARSATWLFHRNAMTQIRKLKTGDGHYQGWVPSPIAGQPDTLLGRPVVTSEFVPATFTSGLYVGIVGDFQRGYWIVDSLEQEIQVLNELLARNNQVSYLTRMKVDGAPVRAEAFARVKLA